MLETRGSIGASNYDLNQVAFRYSARIQELRKEGYIIRDEHVKDSLWRYYLEKSPLKTPDKVKTHWLPEKNREERTTVAENQANIFEDSPRRPVTMPDSWLRLKDKLGRRSYSSEINPTRFGKRDLKPTADLSLPPLVKDLAGIAGGTEV